jgi:hypothetical protein
VPRIGVEPPLAHRCARTVQPKLKPLTPAQVAPPTRREGGDAGAAAGFQHLFDIPAPEFQSPDHETTSSRKLALAAAVRPAHYGVSASWPKSP